MKKSTAERAPSKTREEVVKEALRIEESLQMSAKSHFNATEVWKNCHLWFGIPIAILSAIAAGCASSTFAYSSSIATGASGIAALLSAIVTFLDPNQRANGHFVAGNKCDALMNKVRIFRVIDCLSEDSDLVLTEKLREFSDEKSGVNKDSPQIPSSAYKKAKIGIEAGEASYAVDKQDSR